jgi:hypothetical protein
MNETRFYLMVYIIVAAIMLFLVDRALNKLEETVRSLDARVVALEDRAK